nr:hypothetical protein [uncultured Desulfobacter sp.]
MVIQMKIGKPGDGMTYSQSRFKIHLLKVDPEYVQEILVQRDWAFLKDDRDYKIGDILTFQDPNKVCVQRKISDIRKGFEQGVSEGWIFVSLSSACKTMAASCFYLLNKKRQFNGNENLTS